MGAKKNAKALNQQNLLDFEQRVFNMCLYNAALAIGSSSKAKVKIVTGATGVFLIEGVPYTSPAAQEIVFTATTDDIIADATTHQEKTYLICLNSAGTGSIVGGEQADIGESIAPDVSATLCVVGKVVLSIGEGTTNFDATTDELDETHITDTYTNLYLLAY